MKIIQDQQQRDAAITTDDHAFVYASAGTGKTHTLTMRALYLLLTAPFHRLAKGTDCALLYRGATRSERLRAARAVSRRFVLMTFTRKAAAEMQSRLYEYLATVAGAESLTQLRNSEAEKNLALLRVVETVLDKLGGDKGCFTALQEGARALAEAATELQVSTIHSFASSILRRHPMAAAIPPTAQFAQEDNGSAPDVGEQLIDRWWQKVLTDDTLRGDLEVLLKVVPLADLREWLGTIFEEPWIVNELSLVKPDEKVIKEIFEACEVLANHPKAMKLKAVKSLQEVMAAQPIIWANCCRCVYDLRKDLFLDRLGEDKGKKLKEAISELPTNLRRYFDSYLAIYPYLVAKCLVVEHRENWKRWQHFLQQFVNWADGAAVRELGVVTFDDMMRLSVKLLREQEDVRKEERARLWAILVDEFQDTDPVQLELLEHLLRRSANDPHAVTGFFVGDDKQSIYRFRKADLAGITQFRNGYPVMVDAKGGGIGTFSLTTSFRTLPPITNMVNHLFEHSLPLPKYAQEKLSPVREEPTPLDPEWRLLRQTDLTQTADARRRYLAWETARLIRQHRDNSAKGDKAYSDVVVLVNTYDELDALLPVLTAAGIPAVSSGARTFYREPEVQDVLNLLIAALNPQDSLAVGALLRSPVIGLSDPQIHQLLNEVRPSDLFHSKKALSSAVPPPVQQQIQKVRLVISERNEQAVTEWLRNLRQLIPVGVYAQQDTEGRALVRVAALMESFRCVVEQAVIPPLTWLLEQRARAATSDSYDADLGEDVSVTDESMEAVRLMTIHKSKGLEGNFVIVYGWQKTLDKRNKPAKRKKPVFAVTNAIGQPVRGFCLPWGAIKFVSSQYAEAMELDATYESEEARRLAYVAATRARDRLVLLSSDCSEIAASRLLAEATPLLEGTVSSMRVFAGKLAVTVVEPQEGKDQPRQESKFISDEKNYAKLWSRRMEEMKRPAEPLLHRPSQPEISEEEDVRDHTDYVQKENRQGRELAMETGTLVHAYLERHALDAKFDPTALEELQPQAGNASDAEKIIKKAKVVLGQFYTGVLPGGAAPAYWDRLKRAKVLGRELPVYLTNNGKLWTGLIDLVLEEGGTVIAVDYKLMVRPDPLPATYLQQQRIYTEALQRLFPRREVRFEFWWLILDR